MTEHSIGIVHALYGCGQACGMLFIIAQRGERDGRWQTAYVYIGRTDAKAN